MTRSNYDYELIETSGINFILIVDLCLGGMSVTNDIENVVEEISKKEQVDPATHLIIYKDSQAIWDGWNHKKQDFVCLNAGSFEEAIKVYLHLQVPVKS